jgi:thiol-disulfide isomerase/thioredoxin
MDGKKVNLEQFKGQVLVIDFWFTGCTGCKAIAPILHQLAKSFEKNQRIVFISVSTDLDSQQWIKSVHEGKYTSTVFTQTYTGGLGFDHPLIRAYMIRSAPSLIIIDKNGNYNSSRLPENGESNSIEAYLNYLKKLL